MSLCQNSEKNSLAVVLLVFFVAANGCTNVTALQCGPSSCVEATGFKFSVLLGTRIENTKEERQP